MKLTEIKYKDKTIKVEFKNIEDYAVYYYNHNKLVIRKGLTKRVLGRTLFHELFHIIISVNDFKVAPHGEERVAEWSEEYYNILKQNKVLRNLINRCILVE
jgi:Zn-dependent peptidase ImmA (M78 family)